MVIKAEMVVITILPKEVNFLIIVKTAKEKRSEISIVKIDEDGF
jgi:hypothetical protein